MQPALQVNTLMLLSFIHELLPGVCRGLGSPSPSSPDSSQLPAASVAAEAPALTRRPAAATEARVTGAFGAPIATEERMMLMVADGAAAATIRAAMAPAAWRGGGVAPNGGESEGTSQETGRQSTRVSEATP